ncbi:hypothetical protein AB4865_09125 [Capnocytophaga sp. ARDL2]|uniref:hypothetical protein n=1 Tax=Capnocytophaga sp. ARDL2 TaxID=3238809 RepID=UPI0035582F9D
MKTNFSQLQTNIASLQRDINQVKTENIYLKRVLDIRKSIAEIEKENVNIKITKVEGDTKEKLVYVTMLIENNGKKINGYLSFLNSIIDNEGNLLKIDFNKFEVESLPLINDVPIKRKIAIKYIESEKTQFIKSFGFDLSGKFKDTLIDSKINFDFRNLPIDWK